MTMTPTAAHQLAELPAEPWGWRMKRGRENYAQLTMDQAAQRIGQHIPTSTATISRMESSLEEPTDKRRRALACVAAIVYGLDPMQFGVGSSDLPPGMVLEVSITRLEGERSTRWYAARVVPLFADVDLAAAVGA